MKEQETILRMQYLANAAKMYENISPEISSQLIK